MLLVLESLKVEIEVPADDFLGGAAATIEPDVR